MSDFQVTIPVDSMALQAMFQRLLDFGEDQSVVMADLAEGWLHRTEARFDTQRAPDGTPWTELTEGHKAYKRRKGYPETLLVMEGRLRNELRSDFGSDFAEVATAPLPYAGLMQFGGKSWMAAGPAAVPQREYLGAGPDDLAWMEDTVARHIARIAAGG